jgi:hypothetical protein
VPEFNAFVAHQAEALGMPADLLASRMVGRWRSGAPMELTPLQDDTSLGDCQLIVRRLLWGVAHAAVSSQGRWH